MIFSNLLLASLCIAIIINIISKSIHYSLHSLQRLQFFFTHLLLLVDYADVFYPDAEENLDKLDRLQNLCIRYIFGFQKFEHVLIFVDN